MGWEQQGHLKLARVTNFHGIEITPIPVIIENAAFSNKILHFIKKINQATHPKKKLNKNDILIFLN